jgi:hypothetical protein
MRISVLAISATVVLSLSLIAAACGGDSEPRGADSPEEAGLPTSGMVAPDTFLVFDGERYRLQDDTIQADLNDDDFTEIGVATKADIDFEGELKVYVREGDDDAVYTFSLPVIEDEPVDAIEPSGDVFEESLGDGDEPGSIVAEEPPGQAIDSGAGPVVVDVDDLDEDVAVDSDEGRTIDNPRPDDVPAGVPVEDSVTISADEAVPGGLWLRWVLEP